MDRHLLDIMECPLCGGALSLRDALHSGNLIHAGTLDCSLCHSQFLIQEGVPCFRGPKGMPKGSIHWGDEPDGTRARQRAEEGYALRNDRHRTTLGKVALDTLDPVLDVAGGLGLGACYYLAANHRQVLASDASWLLMRGHAQCAKKRGLSPFLSCIATNVARLPLKADSLGAVTVLSIHDIRGEGGAQGKAVNEAYRCLRPGGSFMTVSSGVDEGTRSEERMLKNMPLDFGETGFITLSAARTTIESFGFRNIRFEIFDERWEKACPGDSLPIEGERLFSYLLIGGKPRTESFA